MNYQIYKFDFQSAVHFGDGGLTKGKNTLCADTIFSALCQEAVKAGKLEILLKGFQDNAIRISDGLPYIDDTYYIPKPLVKLSIEHNGDSKEKKSLKKLEYVPINQLNLYLTGQMDINEERQKFENGFGKAELIEKAAIHEMEDSEPYAVATFTYEANSGLYLLVGTETEELQLLISELLESLSYVGIGGKRSSGYGRFVLRIGKMDSPWKDRLSLSHYNIYCSLSACLPKKAEMEISLEKARYRVIKRSGFIDSDHYAETFRKKSDSYLLASGSSFQHEFEGELLEVSLGGRHPVYRYAKSLLMGVK